jgi:hypothetical protein
LFGPSQKGTICSSDCAPSNKWKTLIFEPNEWWELAKAQFSEKMQKI